MPIFRYLVSFVLLVLGVSLVSPTAFAQRSTPVATVSAFYKFDRSHSQIFNRRSVDARKAWFSDKLYALFLNEIERERQYIRQKPTDKPHFGDGLPFQPLDETCEENGRTYRYLYKVLPTVTRRKTAMVKVVFFYPKPCRVEQTVSTVRLTRTNAGWVIDDLEFPDGSTLVKDLKRESY